MSQVGAVWLVDMERVSDAQLDSFKAWLSPGETLRYGRFVRRQRQRQFLTGRVLLRMALGDLLGIRAATVVLDEQPGRAPLLVWPDPTVAIPHFSLSHSGAWVACAVSADTRLGLDIEVIDPARDIAALGLHAFGAADGAWLQALPDDRRIGAFYRLWSSREARYKLGPCTAPCCIDLPHASLSIALCSAVPLASTPALVMATLVPD